MLMSQKKIKYRNETDDEKDKIDELERKAENLDIEKTNPGRFN